MKERNENFSYKEMTRYTNLPEEEVPDDADNANIVLDNIDYLKQYIDEVINGHIDLVVGNLTCKNVLKLFSYDKTINVLGISCSIDEKGIFTLNGTASENIWIEFIFKFDNNNGTYVQDTDKIKLDSSKKYVYSRQLMSGASEGEIKVSLSSTNNQYVLDLNKNSIIIENEPGINRGFMSILSGTKLTDYKFALQLEPGEKVTDYVCHKDY